MHSPKTTFIMAGLLMVCLASTIGISSTGILDNSRILEQQHIQTTSDESESYKLIDDYCVYWQCLFDSDDGPVGISIIKGYYTPILTYAMGDEQIVCDGFTITDSPKSLTKLLLNWIREGNTVNNKNNLDQPIVNVDMASLTPTDHQHLLASKPSNPIQFIVLRRPPLGKGAPDCYPVLDFLTEKNAPILQSVQ